MLATTTPSPALASHERETTDWSLTEASLKTLAASHHMSLRAVSCQVRAGVVELHGRVATYHLKQIAQALVGRLPSAQAVRNHLVVE